MHSTKIAIAVLIIRILGAGVAYAFRTHQEPEAMMQKESDAAMMTDATTSEEVMMKKGTSTDAMMKDSTSTMMAK